MTNERMRRTMEFIVEQQAQLTAGLQQLQEERKRDRPLNRELRKSFKDLVELLKIQEARLDTAESRLDTAEARLDTAESRLDRVEFDAAGAERRTKAIEINMERLSAAQAHADERLSALINIVMEDRGRSS